SWSGKPRPAGRTTRPARTTVTGTAATGTGTVVTGTGTAARVTAAVTAPVTVSGGTATHDGDHPARRRRHGAPLDPARRPADRHRVTAGGPLGGRRHLGQCGLPR